MSQSTNSPGSTKTAKRTIVPDIKSSSLIHYTQLPDMPSDSALYSEYNTYRRELPRLLAEGLEGRYVLIKGQDIVAIHETSDQSTEAGEELFPDEDFLSQQILEMQPLLRGPWSIAWH